MNRVALILFGLFLVSCESAVERRAESCEGCHRPAGDGIEEAHLRFALRCTDCHGGNAEDTTLAAHVPGMSRAELELLGRADIDAMSPDLLRFLAPTHPNVVRNSCGSSSPQSGAGAGCHQALIGTLSAAQHSTLAGIVAPLRFEKGLQPFRPPNSAVVDTVNPAFVASTAPRFTYGSLNPLAAADLSGMPTALDYAAVVFNKSCTTCHLGGPQRSRDTQRSPQGSYRSVGCAACHMAYAEDGLSQSDDPTGDPTRVGRPIVHELVRSPSTDTCTTCHQQSSFIGPTFRGIRPADNDEPEAAVLNQNPLLGRPAGFWVLDDDGGMPGDDTPPDAHFTAGLQCADCHIATDAHGDGNIWPSQSLEVGMRCESCHGELGQAAGDEDGAFVTSKGAAISRLSRSANGALVLVDIKGESHDVPELDTVASEAHNAEDHGNLTCAACHATWKVDTLRLNQLLDTRERSLDPITGAETLGTVRESYNDVTTTQLFLGQHPDGRIGPLYAEHTVLDVVVPCDIQTSSCTIDLMSPQPGRLVVDNFVGLTSEGRPGLSFRPVTPHTIQAEARPCRSCHPAADGSNTAEVNAVYGQGVGRPTLVDSRGVTLDLTRFVDSAGTSTVALGHLLLRPVENDAVQRALNVTVE